MRRLDSAIPVGLQWVTRVTKLCVRKCVSKYRVFDTRSLELNAPTRRVYRSQRESSVLMSWIPIRLPVLRRDVRFLEGTRL